MIRILYKIMVFCDHAMYETEKIAHNNNEKVLAI